MFFELFFRLYQVNLIIFHIGMLGSIFFEKLLYLPFSDWYAGLEGVMLGIGYIPFGIFITLLYWASKDTFAYDLLGLLRFFSLVVSIFFTIYTFKNKPKFIIYPLVFIMLNLVIFIAHFGIVNNEFFKQLSKNITVKVSTSAEAESKSARAKDYLESNFDREALVFRHDYDDYYEVQLEGDDFSFNIHIDYEVTDNYEEQKVQYLLDTQKQRIDSIFSDLAQQNGMDDVLIYSAYSIEALGDYNGTKINEVFSIEELSKPDAANFVLKSKRLKTLFLNISIWETQLSVNEIKNNLKPFVESVYNLVGDVELKIDLKVVLYENEIPIDLSKAQLEERRGSIEHAEGYIAEIAMADQETSSSTLDRISDESFKYRGPGWLTLSDYDINEKRNSVISSIESSLKYGDKSYMDIDGKYLGACVFSIDEVKEQLMVLLEKKYGKRLPFEIVSYMYMDGYSDCEYLYMKLKAKDEFSTMFTVFADVTDYQLKPTIYKEDYLPRFYENYLAEKVFKLQDLNLDHVWVETYISQSHKESLEYLKAFHDNAYEKLNIGDRLNVYLVSNDRKKRISETQLLELKSKLLSITKNFSKGANSHIYVNFSDHIGKPLYGDIKEQKTIHNTISEFVEYKETDPKETWSYNISRERISEVEFSETMQFYENEDIIEVYKKFMSWF